MRQIQHLKNKIYVWFNNIYKRELYKMATKRPQKLPKSSLLIWHLLHIVKSMVRISSIFVAFLENMNSNNKNLNLNCKQLTNGDLKRVESLSTEDFIRSAKSSPEVKIDQSTVTAIEPCNERGTVMITFSVGKENVKVSRF